MTGQGGLQQQLQEAVELNIQSKPLDASDVKSLEEAKQELHNLRVLALTLYKAHEDANRAKDTADPTSSTHSHDAGAKARHGKARAAVFAGGTAMTEGYEVKSYPKDEETRALLLRSIGESVLFKSSESSDLEALVDAFEPRKAVAEDRVISQGDHGDDFFVVQSGQLRVFVRFPAQEEEVEVRIPYGPGDSFGELALMYNNPRAATVKAASDCTLWAISRMAVRSILTQRKKDDMEQRLELLRSVKIGEKYLKESLQGADLEQLASALDVESFGEGDCIVRQDEVGEVFYIVSEGLVRVVKDEQDMGELKRGQYFGERALLSEERRAASCYAKGSVTCLSLSKDDFDRMLGSLTDLMASTAGIAKVAKHPEDSHPASSPSPAAEAGQQEGGGSASSKAEAGHTHHISVKPDELELVRTLGAGAFGSVKLVKHKPTGQGFALKCQAKRAILENDLQQHVLEERRLLMTMDHPFILRLHDSFQDECYIYLVLELLVGGELFTHLRQAVQFNEQDARFYAASVLDAFSYIHERKIAYRDLKPENLVLDADGYLKVVDFGLAKVVPSGLTWTICGTPDYLAPEIILNEGHDNAVDYWALGVLIYEMVAGVPPFYAEDPMATYEKILGGKMQLPDFFSKNLKDIIRKLLKLNKSKRLGKMRGGCQAVVKHKWFSGFDWAGLLRRELEPPIKPAAKNIFDTAGYDMAVDDNEIEPAAACPEWSPGKVARMPVLSSLSPTDRTCLLANMFSPLLRVLARQYTLL